MPVAANIEAAKVSARKMAAPSSEKKTAAAPGLENKKAAPSLVEDQKKEGSNKGRRPPAKRRKKNRLEVPKSVLAEDPFLNTAVAFYARGPNKPEWLEAAMCEGATTVVNGVEYLFGNVIRREKKVSASYVVEWEHSTLGVTVMEIFHLIGASSLAELLKGVRQEEEEQFPVTPAVLETLTYCSVLEDRSGPLESEDKEEGEDTGDIHDADGGVFVKNTGGLSMGNLREEDLILPSLVKEKDASTTSCEGEEGGLAWKLNASLSPPLNVSRGKRTYLIEDKKMNFVNPQSSFLAFVPLEFWKLYLF